MATGIYRDPAVERAAAAAAARRAQQGRVTVVQPGFVGPLTANTVVAQGPRFGETMSQSQLANAAMRSGGAGLAGGGFWEGGDIQIDPVTRATSPTPAALQNLREEDPWANINWTQLGEWMDTQDPTWRNQGTGGDTTGATTGGTTGATTGGTTGGTTTTPATEPAPAPAPVEDPNKKLRDLLAEIAAAAEGRIKGAGTDLMTALQGRDPMAAYQWNPASVTIPQATLADYVQATGGSPAEVQATRQYGQDLLNAFLGDVGQFAQGVQAADTGWRGRQQDVAGQLEADALRQLALARQAAEMGIEIGAQNRQQALQDQALQLLLQYATAKPKGSTLDITVPNLPFNTVTFPGGNVYVPTSLGGVV